MVPLWGEIAPVPGDRVVPTEGGERLEVGGREIEVAYTPGHASHHVTFFEPGSGTAFVGDTAGVHRAGIPVVIPATPPPEFDLPAWLRSIERIMAWTPARLALTHFGFAADPGRHFDELRHGLDDWSRFTREALELPGSEDDHRIAFVEKVRSWLRDRVDASIANRFVDEVGVDADWRGLERYWKARL
jgi:glyoxylase-like metal-dependent hydrolase (beta-lactamase superfamily II)